MKEKILPHQKIRITRKKLVQLGACNGGLSAVERLLPITLSTDPDRNIPIAKKVLGTDARFYAFWPWVKSCRMADTGMWDEIQDIDNLTCHSPIEGGSQDIQMDTLPQMFAAMADSLLRHKKFRPVGARK